MRGVTDLVLQALIRQVVQALQDQALEHEYPAGGLASCGAFALSALDAGEDGTEYLPVDGSRPVANLGLLRNGVEPFQRVAYRYPLRRTWDK